MTAATDGYCLSSIPFGPISTFHRIPWNSRMRIEHLQHGGSSISNKIDFTKHNPFKFQFDAVSVLLLLLCFGCWRFSFAFSSHSQHRITNQNALLSFRYIDVLFFSYSSGTVRAISPHLILAGIWCSRNNMMESAYTYVYLRNCIWDYFIFRCWIFWIGMFGV